jgi:hypothetical protein
MGTNRETGEESLSLRGGSVNLDLTGRRTQVAKGEVCKTFIRRFESARRLQSPFYSPPKG